jgi:hypothetical protein
MSFVLMAVLKNLHASDRYVSLAGTNDFANKFTTWAGAATDIQWAVNFATNGEIVWVSNGTYYLTNQVYITNGINLKSFSGSWTNTVVNGNNFSDKPVTNRCIYMTHAGAVVEGFTITNGFPGTNDQSGGGVFMTAGTLRDCLVTGNWVTNASSGGGVYAYCTAYAIITNCDFIGNWAHINGGGASIGQIAQIWNCRFFHNRVLQNLVYNGGAGVYTLYSQSNCLNNSIMISNSAAYEGGGAMIQYPNNNCNVRHCLMAENYAGRGGGISFMHNNLTATNTMENCTVASNRVGGIWRSYRGTSVFFNVISQSNDSWQMSTSGGGFFCYHCSTISNATMVFMDSGNITSPPAFADFPGRDYRLSPDSPCANAGLNLPWMNFFTDLDGLSRIDKFSGRADMGCYEAHPRGVMFKAR